MVGELTDTPLISIMMPAYNAERYIRQAIQSIIDQTYTHWELILINDGSVDRTPDILSDIDDERIRIFNQSNQGEAASRNNALKHMQGDFVAFLDSDDQFLPNFLETMAHYLLDNLQLNACYCDGWYIDTHNRQLEPLSNQRRGPFHGKLLEALVRASDVFGPPSCTLIRRDVISANHIQFDTRIVIGPDWDFFTHLAQFTNWGYLDFKGVNYRVHESNITIRTASAKRRESLALCREKAIALPEFPCFLASTRFYVFYDLFMNLLYDQPERSVTLFAHPQFAHLPKSFQARLLRLAATSQIINAENSILVKNWLCKSLILNPFDLKTWLISLIVWINPNLAQKLLKRRIPVVQSIDNTPFGLHN
ncbi:MAG: hypothetical protein BGO78_13560 [Chloroflexi bacterium 44-23]|nr:MAG: hypothetical protein BGO78_13560 [Chloroflexi bacterium 44-23]